MHPKQASQRPACKIARSHVHKLALRVYQKTIVTQLPAALDSARKAVAHLHARRAENGVFRCDAPVGCSQWQRWKTCEHAHCWADAVTCGIGPSRGHGCIADNHLASKTGWLCESIAMHKVFRMISAIMHPPNTLRHNPSVHAAGSAAQMQRRCCFVVRTLRSKANSSSSSSSALAQLSALSCTHVRTCGLHALLRARP